MQGAYVDAENHLLRLSWEKTEVLMRATLLLCCQWKPSRHYAERCVGKLGHAHSFRVCLRAAMSHAHWWLHDGRELRLPRLIADIRVVKEGFLAALTLPLAEIRIGERSAPWRGRAVCSDAAPGGNGMAYAEVGVAEVARRAQFACHKGDYTILQGKYEYLKVAPDCVWVMKRAEHPLSEYFWHTVARPGFYRHITLEEAAVHIWSFEASLHRLGERGHRVLHVGDSAAEVGASARGRSSTRSLNRFCQQSAAIELAGDFTPFRLWEESKKNPADEPSSRHGLRARRGQSAAQEALVDAELGLPAQGDQGFRRGASSPLAGASLKPQLRVLTFVLLFSGPRRKGDLQDWLEFYCARERRAHTLLGLQLRHVHRFCS